MRLLLDTHTLLWFLADDPFDHVIAATAIVEELTLVSVDVAFDRYGLERLW